MNDSVCIVCTCNACLHVCVGACVIACVCVCVRVCVYVLCVCVCVVCRTKDEPVEYAFCSSPFKVFCKCRSLVFESYIHVHKQYEHSRHALLSLTEDSSTY